MNAVISFEELVARKISHIQVKGEGVVTSILNDDTVGRKHQRFVLELAPHKTLLVLNNIDIFPRLAPLEIGNRVEFYGEYIWNRHGGIIHWTHDDPRGVRAGGYVKLAAGSPGIKTPIPTGIYRHFKGGMYEITGFATHSETLEDMVIYQSLRENHKTWVRPLSMWEEVILHEGMEMRRFTLVESELG